MSEDQTFKRPVAWVSLGFFCIFLAFNSTQSLATSLNDKTLATACFAALYGTFALACCAAPAAVNYFGPKLSMIIGGSTYLLMVASYLKPMFATSLIAHVLVGAGASLLWTGLGITISRFAALSSKLTGNDFAAASNLLNGVFFSFFHFNGAVGLVLASSVVMLFGSGSNTLLFTIFTALCGVGLIVFFITPNPPTVEDISAAGTNNNNNNNNDDAIDNVHVQDGAATPAAATDVDTTVSVPSFTDVLKLIAFDPRMALLSPVICFNGLTMSFLFGDLSATITHAVGIKHVGFVLATYYCWNTIFTLIWTRLVNFKTRPAILFLALFAHTLFLALLTCLDRPENFIDNPDTNAKEKQIQVLTPVILDYVKCLCFCFTFSVGDSILQQQQQSLLQIFYAASPSLSDTAMAGMKLTQSAGVCIFFAIGVITTNIDHKIAVLWAALGVAFICMVAVVLKYVPSTEGCYPDDEYAQLVNQPKQNKNNNNNNQYDSITESLIAEGV